MVVRKPYLKLWINHSSPKTCIPLVLNSFAVLSHKNQDESIAIRNPVHNRDKWLSIVIWSSDQRLEKHSDSTRRAAQAFIGGTSNLGVKSGSGAFEVQRKFWQKIPISQATIFSQLGVDSYRLKRKLWNFGHIVKNKIWA